MAAKRRVPKPLSAFIREHAEYSPKEVFEKAAAAGYSKVTLDYI